MPEFTGQQLDAIDYRGLDACVVAGPGSGKTTVLVERFYRLVTERGFDPGEILAITFTEKAAANMKEKLAGKFAGDRQRLRDLESAWVSTIHGFCARLLKENAIAAGIDPRFRVLDAREADGLQFECLSDALDKLTAQRREAALALIEALPAPALIAAELRSVYDAIRSSGRSIGTVRAMPSPIPPQLPSIYEARLVEALHAWPKELTATQRSQRSELFEFTRSLSSAQPKDLRAILRKPPIGLNRVPSDHRATLRQFREDLELLRAKLLDLETAPHRAALFDVLARFETIYSQRKESFAALDFNDLERRSIELLRRDEAVRTRVRQQFRQVMLDEFQDINEQQSE
ncbi:MAG: UvrD-helicase domain-containing protein, partial [Acidobacteriota bacterium]|nr:UvrD-helicase domain-containing protein [Acidobacteriota bacterium]